jgi:methanogenic corrinoid protein MtbC1
VLIDTEQELIKHKHLLAELARHSLDDQIFEFHGDERLKMVFDLETHLAFLGEALRCSTPQIFNEYAIWTNQLLVSSGGDTQQFRACLHALETQIQASGTGDWLETSREYLANAVAELDNRQPVTQSFLNDDNPHVVLARAFLQACLSLNRQEAMQKTQDAVSQGVSVNDIYLYVITPVLHELGRLWHLNQITIGHEHYCTAVAQMIMAQLFPWIFDGSKKKKRMVSTCVAGELHEIGARMVADLFEMNGWDTVFLGADVPIESVIDILIQHDAHILTISVTLASHLGEASEMIAAVRANPACANVKIMVGGAAFNIDQTLWRKLNADGWAKDGQTAVAIAETLERTS